MLVRCKSAENCSRWRCEQVCSIWWVVVSDCGVGRSVNAKWEQSRAERLWEAAHTGLGRSPPAGVCRLTDSSALVYHTAAAAAAAVRGRECWAGRNTPDLLGSALQFAPWMFKKDIISVMYISRIHQTMRTCPRASPIKNK